jgi:cytochrome c
MKKTFTLFLSLVIVAGGNYYSYAQTKKPVKKTSTATTKTKTKTSSSNSNLSKADVDQGKQLLSKSDCLTCHQVQVKVVGPAYSAVAAKYPATTENIDKLADKIIKGGSGSWGQIPMTPHPSVAKADAEKMVKYILSLKAK